MLETPAEAQGSPRERDPDMADTLPLSANVSPSPATPQRRGPSLSCGDTVPPTTAAPESKRPALLEPG
ncbi:hypothetical protein EYF80_050299 [Liparis tanakae]|uniref:Uncharacterized protein n=1 Tax=Liparis tanakae TaxID=230148 RepID=A0A4Z2FFI3_9TELE|nr:hypothetical protein EYF80_050299 [Liparis tanakae]